MLKKNFDFTSEINNQHGAIIVMTAILLITILGFLGLAIDIGYMMTVRNQLQNAADAAALEGAHHLVDSPAPNFNQAKTHAIAAFTSDLENTANNVVLAIDGSDANQIDTGYWDMSGSLPGINHPSGSIPGTNTNLVPAVKVSVPMNSVINNPINTFFMNILGNLSYNMRATAVAVAPPAPSCIGEGALLPFVMNKCAYDEFWDSSTNPGSPKLVPDGTTSLPGYPTYKNNGKIDIAGPTETAGQPWKFWLTSTYHADNRTGSQCAAGQWSALNTNASNKNSEQTISDIIQNFGKSNSNIDCSNGTNNSQVWISNGTMSVVYDNLSKNQYSILKCASIPAGTTGSCAYALIPVIDVPKNTSIPTGTYQTVVAFACVHITTAKGGPDFYIEVQMVAENDPNNAKYCVAPNAGGVGPGYGVAQPPGLVNYFGNTY
jgi:Flp pilus assembly protein TadG